jgi:uncharacterized protein (DUF58 family)
VRTTPDRRLLALSALWVLAALAAVVWPWLGPALAGASLLFAAVVGIDLWAWRGEPELQLGRRIPERAHVGRACEIRLVLENRAGRAVEADVYEALPEDLAPVHQVFAAVRVPAGGGAEVPVELQPTRRGDRELGVLVAQVRSPLGLFRRRVAADEPVLLRVYPDTSALLRPEALDPRQMLQALGVRPARRRGEGMEFESLRDYVPGDDPRRLDWAASARRARPVVRLHQHERHHTVVIALDASRLMAGRIGSRTLRGSRRAHRLRPRGARLPGPARPSPRAGSLDRVRAHRRATPRGGRLRGSGAHAWGSPASASARRRIQ